MAQRNSPPSKDTIISRGLQLQGGLRCEGNLLFDGTIVGNIDSQADVEVGPNAYIEGNITCHNLTFSGRIKGDLKVEARAIIHNSASINGDIEAMSLGVEEGAHINGKLSMPIPETEDLATEERAEAGDNNHT